VHGVFFRRDAELVVEGVVPNLLHVIPVSDSPCSMGYFKVKIPRLACASSLLSHQ
jgi:hypothetical protein